jgi:GAF domain-containing protein
VYRQEVHPFTDKQIELVKNFAAQAVIAIENTRLLNELRQSLEQQTATADVLRVISSSPGELEPVFQSMLENATRICEAKFGNMLLLEGDVFRYVALYGASPEFAAERQRDPIIRPKRRAILDRLLKTRQAVQIADVLTEGGTDSSAIVTLAGARTVLMVPMLKHDDLIGGLGIYRQEVRPFTDKQIELVSTSPPRPSLPSRTRDCLASCDNHYGSRLRLPTCSRSSVGRLSICRLYSTHW